MATKKATTPATDGMRRCIGSATFGIEPHEAPTSDFPTQPSQKDGLGRMCKPHWRAYTNALRKAALARKAAEAEAAPEPVAEPDAPAPPKRGRRAKATADPEPEAGATTQAEEVAPGIVRLGEGELLVTDRPADAAEEA